MEQVVARLTNFGTIVYEGHLVHTAMDAAERAGFEATVFVDGVPDCSWSPIGGWRLHSRAKELLAREGYFR